MFYVWLECSKEDKSPMSVEEREARGEAGAGDLVEERLRKLGELERRGVAPYGQRFPRSHSVGELRQEWKSPEQGPEDGPVRVAGRLMSLRSHGKAQFADLKDETGRIQIYVKLDIVGEDGYETFRLLDIGDIVGVTGRLFWTRTGELTIEVRELIVLSKALRPMPEKWHGLKDIETRYRQRHVDLTVNRGVKEVFLLRSRLVREIRAFLDERMFVEVETPMLHPIPGGATGHAFSTHQDALDVDLYLRIAPELYLKRLLAGGFERVYEMNRSFRNEGLSPRHNPEFTMLEVYAAYADYGDMMRLAEELIGTVTEQLTSGREIEYQGGKIDFSSPWKRMTFREAMLEEFGIELGEARVEILREKLQAAGVKLEGGRLSRTRLVNLFAERLTASQPTFITDYPAELCPLSKRKPDGPDLAERFELFVGGLELANAYSEQNDPREQRRRLEAEAEKARGGEEAMCLDEDFLAALEFGMPPAGGLGIGVDRLVMLLANVATIREVIFFPQLRPERGVL